MEEGLERTRTMAQLGAYLTGWLAGQPPNERQQHLHTAQEVWASAKKARHHENFKWGWQKWALLSQDEKRALKVTKKDMKQKKKESKFFEKQKEKEQKANFQEATKKVLHAQKASLKKWKEQTMRKEKAAGAAVRASCQAIAKAKAVARKKHAEGQKNQLVQKQAQIASMKLLHQVELKEWDYNMKLQRDAFMRRQWEALKVAQGELAMLKGCKGKGKGKGKGNPDTQFVGELPARPPVVFHP